MKEMLLPAYSLLRAFGIDPLQTFASVRGLPGYVSDLKKIKLQQAGSKEPFRLGRYNPCLADRFAQSGCAKGHYFHQDLLVARRIFSNRPTRHVDVGSRVDGFVAHVAAFREIEIIDIRPLSSRIPNVEFIKADLMSDVDEKMIDYCDSLSCLHALEHFGLGRYGDPVNVDGYLKGLENMSLILQKQGKFYLSVPIGPQRIEFNAHRVYSVAFLTKLLRNTYDVDKFSYVDDKGDLHEDVDIDASESATNFNCRYGCGIYELTKR